MGQFVRGLQGVGEACKFLDFPIVSGNVSLYNETNGEGILPTPTIAGVGLIADATHMARIGFAGEGEAILLIGAPDEWGTHLGQSRFLSVLFGRDEGEAPPVDLEHEKKTGNFVRALIRAGTATACHDLSDGGLGVALAEMTMASGIGAKVTQLNDDNPVAVFFGEDQGRYLVTIARDDLDAVEDAADRAGVSLAWIGTTDGDALQLGEARAIPVADLTAVFEDWFPRFMAG
jgi:phosphoribosylformylglycinamidine synthase